MKRYTLNFGHVILRTSYNQSGITVTNTFLWGKNPFLELFYIKES